jgi:hypothetical protein
LIYYSYTIKNEFDYKLEKISMKKIVLTLALALAVIPGTSFAAGDVACVKTAVETRESSLIAAYGKFNTAIVAAMEKRKDSLSDAWSQSEAAARKSARKSAFSTFKSERKSAVSTFKSEKKSAWTTFKSTVTSTCKAPEAATEEPEKTSVDPV